MLCSGSTIYVLYVTELNICALKMSVVSHLPIDSTEHLKGIHTLLVKELCDSEYM